MYIFICLIPKFLKQWKIYSLGIRACESFDTSRCNDSVLRDNKKGKKKKNLITLKCREA